MAQQWKVNGSETGTLAVWVEDEQGKRVCTMRPCETDLDNARKCAAAPDMLAALARSKEWIEVEMADKGWPMERIKNPPEGSHLHAINDAIAKATA
jgi:hypothetical protein